MGNFALSTITKNNCSECPFKSRTSGDGGNIKSRLVIVGESPRSAELKGGSPFLGESGKFLKVLCKDHGVLEEPYYLHAFNCKAPNDEKRKKEGFNDACRACHDDLIRKIAAHPRKLIVAFGNAALRSLTEVYNANITRERGILRPHNLASVGLLPMLHPGFVLANEGVMPTVQLDMQKIPKLLNDETVSDPSYKIKIVNSDGAVRQLANKAMKYGMLSSDIESTGLNRFDDEITCIGLLPLYRDPVMRHEQVKNFNISKTTVYVIDNMKWLKELCKLMKTKGETNKQIAKKPVSWIWHNGKFDIGFLWNNGFDRNDLRVDEDTMLLSYALDENGGRHGLERCIMDWLGVMRYKGMLDDYTKLGSKIHTKVRAKIKKDVKDRKLLKSESKKPELYTSYIIDMIEEICGNDIGITDEMKTQYVRTGYNKESWSLIPKPLLYEYLGKDIIYTAMLFDKLSMQVREDNYLTTLYDDMLIPASNALSIVESNGFPVDQSMIDLALESMEKLINPIVEKIRVLVGNSEFKPSSNVQVLDYMQNTLKLCDDKGVLLKSTGKEFLEPLAGNKFVDLLLEFRKYKKLLSTNILPFKVGRSNSHPGLERGRVNTSFLIHGTVTGRLSSTSPNIQNWPKNKETRVFVKPKKGRIFVSLDYSQAELRSLAVLSGDENLINIFKSGKDLHTAVAEQVYGEKFTSLNKEIEEEAYKWSILRRNAKTINFGVVYGVQEGTLSKNLNITIEEASGLIDGWFNEFPDAKKFILDTKNIQKAAETLITLYGRKRRFHIITNKNKHSLGNAAGNFLHQSMCSDFTLESCININWRKNLLDGLGGYPKQVNIIHDDNMFEIDNSPEFIIDLIKIINKEMVQVPIDMGITQIPFKADASIGESWDKLRDVNMDKIWEGKGVLEYV